MIETAHQEKTSPLDEKSLYSKHGNELIVAYYRLLKGSILYDKNNSIIAELTEQCRQVFEPLLEQYGHISLQIIRDNFYFNNHRISLKVSTYPTVQALFEALHKRCIGRLDFRENVDELFLRDFTYHLQGLEFGNEHNYLSIRQFLHAKGANNIDVDRMRVTTDADADSPDEQRQKVNTRELYFQTISAVRGVIAGVKNKKQFNIRRAKHIMQHTVDAIIEDPSSIMALLAIKNYDDYTYSHSANVAFVAIALGLRIGIPKTDLARLGLAALFHDIGKIQIPLEILNKPASLTAEEWEVIRRHPTDGAFAIMQMRQWGDQPARMIAACVEHHMKFDHSGYPSFGNTIDLSLFGRIISIADVYDALGRPRVYRPLPYVSEHILGQMLERSGKDFDPILVKVLANMIGIFPIGMLVQMDTGEMGIVTKINEDNELIDRPQICLIRSEDGGYAKGETIDLGEKNPATGGYLRTITNTLDPNDIGLNILNYF